MAEGLDIGINGRSAIITRGIAEMRRINYLMGGRQSTLMGLAGIGDTYGTCFGASSRNRKTGQRLGAGETLEEILETSAEVSEGVPTARALARLVKEKDRSYRIDLKYPIIFGLGSILNDETTPIESFKAIMNDPLRMELYEL
eukprot:CAMPEP_0167764984 /NCGR_PEP_ID=MMETSP0110_2-20121227/14398_1 /TAXON_ID=629695 /ORGANISM="Gymnochlora sp., Strain CCMP2014" /LENGTH=142 /DNA_ID=CAMNT_0007652573 /DNA_START=1 /DNA_END=426 /DNA_ORIENTATION=+